MAAKPKGRPPSNKPTKKRKSISLTQMQWDCLELKAEALGFASVSAYITRQLFGHPSGATRTKAKVLKNKKKLGLI